MSTTSRLEKSSCQLVGRLARKVESDSPVGIPGAPGRLVADLKTEIWRRLGIGGVQRREGRRHTEQGKEGNRQDPHDDDGDVRHGARADLEGRGGMGAADRQRALAEGGTYRERLVSSHWQEERNILSKMLSQIVLGLLISKEP
jgi:hypothetical protein